MGLGMKQEKRDFNATSGEKKKTGLSTEQKAVW